MLVNERWYICHGSVEIVDEVWMMSKQDASHRGHVRFQKMVLFLKTTLRNGLNKLTGKNRAGFAEYSPDNKSDATFEGPKTSSNSILLPSFSALHLADNIEHRIISLLLLGNPGKGPPTTRASCTHPFNQRKFEASRHAYPPFAPTYRRRSSTSSTRLRICIRAAASEAYSRASIEATSY